MHVLARLLLALCVLRSAAIASSPSSPPINPIRSQSYLCLAQSKSQNICLGFSPGPNISDPTGANLYNTQLQVKRRDANFLKDTEFKTKWDVDRKNGSIRASDFSNLCVARLGSAVILRPCFSAFERPPWNLTAFLTSVAEGGQIRTKSSENLCVTAMQCVQIPSANKKSYTCSQTPVSALSNAQVSTAPDVVYGSYVSLLKCNPASYAQQWVQALDCAPGCAPSMLVGPKTGPNRNVCDAPCDNAACNWDNGACATPKPTPPTLSPSFAPSSGPSYRPSTSPTLATPSASPSASPASSSPTNAPTRAPTSTKPSRAPSSSPSGIPSTSPSSSLPTRSPSAAPTRSPSAAPTRSPSAAPTRSPSASPTRSPSAAPTRSPSTAPSHAPTSLPLVPLASAQTTNIAASLLGLWIFLGIFCCLYCSACVPFFYPEEQKALRRAQPQPKPQPEAGNPQASKRPWEPSNDADPDLFRASRRPPPVRPSPAPEPPRSADNPFDTIPEGDGEPAFADDDSPPPSYRMPPERGEPPPPAPAAAAEDPESPRHRAARTSLNPNPELRPKMGEPGLFWGGSRTDLGAGQVSREERLIQKRTSGRLLEAEILPAHAREIERRTSGNLAGAAQASSSSSTLPPPPALNVVGGGVAPPPSARAPRRPPPARAAAPGAAPAAAPKRSFEGDEV